MKKLIYSIMAICIIAASSCTQEETNFVYNEEALTLDKIVKANLFVIDSNGPKEVTTEYLKLKWQSALEQEGINVTLEKFEIIQITNDSDQPSYFLKSISSDRTVETGAFLEMNSSISAEFGLPENSFLLGKKTCTCQGCASSCNLTVTGTICRCSPCPPGGSQQCIKTETIDPGNNN